MSEESNNSPAENDYADFDIASSLFDKYDTENEGSICTESVLKIFNELDLNISERSIDVGLDYMDPDASGRIKKEIFFEWFRMNEFDYIHKMEEEQTPRSQKKNTKTKDPMKQLNMAMIEAKSERKRAEKDVQLLANRLAHLRAEEEKARKRIEETNKRAKEIQGNKIRKSEKQKQRQLVYEKEKSQINQATQYHAYTVAESKRKKKLVTTTKLQEKVQIVQESRMKKSELKEIIRRDREEERKRLVKKRETIQKQQQEAIRKREMKRKQQEKEMLDRARTRLSEEHKKKVLSEQVIKEMELEEARLIAQLKETQNRQREAYLTLENALQLEI